MSRQSVEATQLVDEIEVELFKRDQERVQRGRVVTLRREVDVRVRRVAVWIDEAVGPQPGNQIHRAEARADVTRTGAHDHVERIQAAEVRDEGRARYRIAAVVAAHAPDDVKRDEGELAASGELLV